MKASQYENNGESVSCENNENENNLVIIMKINERK
jgi:hypothetical protein